MSSIIRSLVVKVGADLSEFDKSLKTMSKNLAKTGKEFTNAGKALTTGLTVPIVGAAAGIAGLAIKAGQGADALITLSNKTGLSTDALQELEYAARFVDVEVETMTGSMIKLTKNMDMARRGSKEQEEAFKRLGVEYKNNDGSLKNAKQVWAESLEALKNISSEADRDALAMNLFGKSAVELNPLIKAGGEELRRLGEEAHTVGAVMSGDTVTQLGAFDDQMQKFQAVLKTAGGELGAAFLPLLEKLIPVLQDSIIPAIASFAEKVGVVVDKFMSLSPQTQGFILAALGIAAALGPVLMMFGTVMTTLGGVAKMFTLLTGPVGIVILVITALIAIGILLYKNWDTISAFLLKTWETIKTTAETIFNAVKTFFVELWDGIKLTIETVWNGIKLFVSGVWEGIKTTASTVFNALKVVFETVWGAIKLVFKTYTDGIIAVFDIFKKIFQGDWEGAWNGIKSFFSGIWTGIVSIAENSLNGIIGIVNKAIEWINKIPGVDIKTVGKVDLSGGKTIPHADGGIFTRPTMWGNHLIGESGPEALVPLNKMGTTANIIVELDGYTIAKAVGQPLVDIIRLKTGIKI